MRTIQDYYRQWMVDDARRTVADATSLLQACEQYGHGANEPNLIACRARIEALRDAMISARSYIEVSLGVPAEEMVEASGGF